MLDATVAHAAGPDELLRLKAQYLIPCVYHFYRQPPQIIAGEGCWLIDHAGRRYLDCYSGVTVMSAGHCIAEIIEPAIQQIRTLQHTTSIYLTEPVLRLGEALAEITPGDLCRSFFCASGSEAVEGALLLACLHTRRPDVLAMTHGLHGRTRWAMSVTGLDLWRSDPFPLPTVHHVPFGEIAPLEAMLQSRGERIAAVVAEPILGNGGIVVPGSDYWPAVRRLCDRFGVLLVLDEIQTGMNRTGRWFACEHWRVQPDIMTISKALGNGFPIAAFIATEAIAASYTRPGASTYGGNPVASAAALATIQYHREHQLGLRARQMGETLRRGLSQVSADVSGIAQPRGMGLMLGLPVCDLDGSPAPQRCDELLERLKDRGVLAGKTGHARNILTFMPPLIIDRSEVNHLLQVVADAVMA